MSKIDDIFDTLNAQIASLTGAVELDAYGRGLAAAAKVVAAVRDMRNDEKRLMAGEMTAQEIRSLNSWLGVIADTLREHSIKHLDDAQNAVRVARQAVGNTEA